MKFFKNLIKRTKEEKGLSGVVVALALVVVGIGLVVTAQSIMNNQMDSMDKKVGDQIKNF